MDNIRVGLIGYGYWGPNLLRNFYAHPRVQVKWVSDLLPKNIEKVHRFYPTIQTTTEYQDLLRDPDLDTVIIAVPTKYHFAIAKEALEAKKHVFIEKPITQTSEQAKELIKLSKKMKRKLCVDHPFVFSDAVQKMKEMITKKALGELYYYDSLRLNMGLIQPDINVITDLAPHDFSIINYLMDGKQPKTVSAVGSCHVGDKQEEVAHIHLSYASGFVADITLSWLSPLKVRQIMLVGSKAMVSFDDTDPSEKIRLYDKGVSITRTKITPFAPLYRSGDILIPKLNQTETLSSVADSFVRTILDGITPPNDGVAGLRVVELIEQSQQSLKESYGTKHKAR